MALPFAFCRSEEHSEAIINPYDCHGPLGLAMTELVDIQQKAPSYDGAF